MQSETLRFVTDNDVDAAVAAALRSQGHQAWTASDAELAEAADADLAVYADDQNAILVSHDRQFSRWRRQKMFGRHIWLHIDQPDAAEVLMEHLPDFVEVLRRRQHVQVEVRRDSHQVHKPRWPGT